MATLSEYFEGLSSVLAPEDVRLTGAWASKTTRRYASRNQLGTGEGPFVDVIDWRWEGRLEGASPLVGLALLFHEGRITWVKSRPPAPRLDVSFSTAGWVHSPGSVSATGSLHGAYLPAVRVELDDDPPAACVVGKPAVKVGSPHPVMETGRAFFAIVVLPASAVTVGRNRLWRARESIVAGLDAAQAVLLTRGRSGAFDSRGER
ncbi:MAG TPA: hypothetical protein VIY73_22395 [Polyangiaceae bacterium]